MSYEIKVTVILQGSPQKKNCWSGPHQRNIYILCSYLSLFYPHQRNFCPFRVVFGLLKSGFPPPYQALGRTLVLDKKASLLLVVPFTVSPSAIVTLYRLRECMSLETQRQLQLLFQVFKHYCHPGPYILHFKNKK